MFDGHLGSCTFYALRWVIRLARIRRGKIDVYIRLCHSFWVDVKVDIQVDIQVATKKD